MNTTLARLFGRTIWHETVARKIGGERNFDDFLSTSPDFYDRSNIVIGHYHSAHALVRHSPRPPVLMAVMREPVTRIVSLYEYIRRRTDHPIHAEVIALSLAKAFHEVPGFRGGTTNSQLMQIFGAATKDGIQAAMAERSYILGHHDHLPLFASTVARHAGLSPPEELPRLNAAPAVSLLEPAQQQADYAQGIEAIRATNAAEIAFFADLSPITVTAAS